MYERKNLSLNAAEHLVEDGIDRAFLLHALKKERASQRALPLTYMCHTLFNILTPPQKQLV